MFAKLTCYPQRIGPSLLSAVPTIRGDSRNANGLAPTKNGEGTLEKQVENLTSASRSRRVRLSRSSCRLPGCSTAFAFMTLLWLSPKSVSPFRLPFHRLFLSDSLCIRFSFRSIRRDRSFTILCPLLEGERL